MPAIPFHSMTKCEYFSDCLCMYYLYIVHILKCDFKSNKALLDIFFCDFVAECFHLMEIHIDIDQSPACIDIADFCYMIVPSANIILEERIFFSFKKIRYSSMNSFLI